MTHHADHPAPPRPLASLPLSEFLSQVAAKTPAPGGGAVAAAAGALAASIAAMVVNYSIPKKSLAEHRPQLESALAQLLRASAMALELAEEDARAFSLVQELSRLPEADARRAAELPAASLAAVHIPLSSAAAAVDLLRLLVRLAPITNRALRSDLAVAAALARAAADASLWNVRVNLPLLKPGPARADLAQQALALAPLAESLARDLARACDDPADDFTTTPLHTPDNESSSS